jgi:hypothetical protein
VFYVIEVKKGQRPQVTIDRIEYGGLFGSSGKVSLGVKWVGRRAGDVPAVGDAVNALNIALKGLNAVQRKLISNREPAAVQALDVLSARVAQEA